jgi:hypothetical protein
MKRWLPVVTVLAGLALMASTAFAQNEGIKLAWDNCQAGPGAALDKSFACDINTGTNIMYGSYIAPDSISLFTSNEAVLDLISGTDPLPLWWQLRNQTGQTGQCRTGSLSVSADFTSITGCVDVFGGAGVGGIGTYLVNPLGRGTNTVRFTLVFSVPTASQTALTPGTEYYAFRASVNNAKTLGSGSCAGCTVPVCIVLNGIKIVQPAGTPHGNELLINPPPGGGTRSITWQGGTGADCNLVPTRNHTWGQVKALYR